MAEEEQDLMKKRKSLKGTMTRISNYVNKFDPKDSDIQEIIVRQTTLENTYENINDVQDKLEIIDYDKHEPVRVATEEKYFSTKAVINKVIKDHENMNVTQTPSNNTIGSQNGVDNTHVVNLTPQVKLPELNIPTFAGDYQDWQNFKDLFVAVIDNNTQILPIQKLYYLKGALKGEALKIIQAVTPSADNYPVAWQLLKERYDNKQFNVNIHLKALFDHPNITRDSVGNLRKLLTDTKQHLRSLEVLKIPVKEWDVILVYMLSNKLDQSMRRDWELSKKGDALPSLEKFYNFLEQRCLALEFVNQDRIKSTNKAVHAATVSSNNARSKQCRVCKENFHPLYQCDTFIKYDLENKLKAIKYSGACYNCLRFGHNNYQCKAQGCKICNKKHNSMIHQDRRDPERTAEALDQTTNQKQEVQSADASSREPETKQAALTASLHNSTETSQVLLSTARIKIQDNQGGWLSARAILDSASQINFITKQTIKQLNIQTSSAKISINGISETSANAHEIVQLNIASNVNNFRRKLEFIVLENITCNLPVASFDIADWKIPQNLTLADPGFNESDEIEILLGGEVFYEALETGHLQIAKNLPTMQNTRFGWIIGGKISSYTKNHKKTVKQSYLTVHNTSLETAVAKFWDLETLTERRMTLEERNCEEHFEKNVTRSSTGSYIVKLPLKMDQSNLGNSYCEALHRFNSLENRFEKNPEIKAQYVEFMNQYLALDHMQLAPNDPNEKACYLPHHPVFKTMNNSKIRVVFDASMKTSSGKSLNDILMVGPVVQPELIEIVLRFRTHLVAFTADIQKMYRQIFIHKDQLDLQRIIWRNNKNDELKSYQLKTVTYGTAAAPYLATKSLNKLACDEEKEFPIAAAIAVKDFYVDDIMTGANSVENALLLQQQLISLLKQGNLKLHKWCSNSEDLLKNIDPQDRETTLPLAIGNNEIKTLGLLWLPSEDKFKFVMNVCTEAELETKRSILRQIASIFDPLGILGPIITLAKLLMQELWKTKLEWDEPAPNEILIRWKQWRNHLDEMKDIKIPRCLFVANEIKGCEIHGFCDASQVAYGAVLYILTEYIDESKSVRLICSKARVAPIKQVTIPRLELCGALILARLVNKVVPSLEINLQNIYLWTDSMIVLAWLQSPPTRWQTFVANRTSEIQELTLKCEWNHVESENNPADCLSRGMYPDELSQTKDWWTGPQFIQLHKDEWPKTHSTNVEIPEEKKQVSLLVIKPWSIFDKFSSLQRLQRTTAYCLRFLHNCQKIKQNRISGPLLPLELQRALKVLIRRAQAEEYAQEITQLQAKKLPYSLRSLNPFLDSEELLRVGGRIQKSSVAFDQRHPIMLPKKHILTKLIIQHEHKKQLHGGIQATLNSVRRNFWPIHGRSLTRKVINRCVTCHRFKKTKSEQIMGNLPSVRVQATRPFLNVGVDFGGPLFVKQGQRRNSPLNKTYISLFICLCTRAIHIELVNDLTAKSFILALQRFMARRGKCQNIYSDNGTNFHGANHELHQLYQLFRAEETREYILESAANQGITWHFIPPNSPHFGGIWEAGIKSVKFHLKRIVGNAHLNYEEMYTTLTLIESCLNSRPLIPITDDPDDLSVITPAHFLIGDLLTNVPEPDIKTKPTNLLTKWQQIQSMQQHFWQRWSHDYLNFLQQRHKWNNIQPNHCEGKVVLLKEDNLPPLNWRLARITKVYPGEDDHVRVVSVKLSNGKEIKRPITKICPLPIDEED